MPLDAITLNALVCELEGAIVGAKIDKIHQPEREELFFSLRSKRGNTRLYLSAAANHPGIRLADERRDNPAAPPMFCMLLRKRLVGGRISAISQQGMERAVSIEIDCYDELGDETKNTVVVELQGRHSNIILVGGDGRIIDCLKRIDSEMSEKRQLLPGLFYRVPPAPEKIQLLDFDRAAFLARLSEKADETLDQVILKSYLGVSPLIAREIAFRTALDASPAVFRLDESARGRAADEMEALCARVREQRYEPMLLYRSGEELAFDFTFMPILQYGASAVCRKQARFSDLLLAYYDRRERAERIRRRTHDMQKVIQTQRDRLVRKLSSQREELKKSVDREGLRIRGDLLTANLYRVERGGKSVTVTNFYDENEGELTIALDVRLSPQQNAQKYYKDYAKAKNAEQALTEQIATGERERAYLESVLQEIARAETEKDVSEIREELKENGYLARAKGEKGKKQPPLTPPVEYRTTDGFAVFAGRNNRQNEQLTLRTAFKSDWWFHTQKIPGSHVILVCEGEQPTDLAMTEAAMIAAYHSQASESALVPVDYTQVRHVKKLYGGKTGMVNYENFQTAFVTPDKKRVEAMRIQGDQR